MSCTCNNGLVFTRDGQGTTRMYVCACPLGEPYRRTLHAPSDKKKERGFKLREWKTKAPPDTKVKQYKDDE